MAISKPLIVSINRDRTKPNEKMFIYRNDVGVDMYIELTNLTYKFDGSKNFKFANALFKTPSDVVHTVNNLAVVDGRIKFSFNQEVVANIQEIGKYELQFQIFDMDKNRLTIPSYFFEVKEPLGNTQMEFKEGIVDFSYVDYSYVPESPSVDLFAVEDGYIKTNWQTGDLITSERMNNIEDGIEMALSREVEADVIYVSNKPSTISIGGIPLGYTSSGISLVNLIDTMLHPYKSPTVSLSISPTDTLYELGSTVNLSLRVTASKGSEDAITLGLLKNGSTLSYNSSTTLSSTQNNITSDVSYEGYVTDGTNTIKTDAIYIEFINPIYIGYLIEVDSASIRAMTKRIVKVSSQSYGYTMSNRRMCIAVPSSWSTINSIIDANGFNITQSFAKTTVNIYCADGVNRAYTVYYSELTSLSNFIVNFNF